MYTGDAGSLVRNYRSHNSLLMIPNELFYEQALVAAADQSELLPPSWSELDEDQASDHDPALPVKSLPSTLFYGVRGQQVCVPSHASGTWSV